jgi:hypothetical protein
MSYFWQCLGAVVLGKSKPISATEFKHFFKLPTQLVGVIWKRVQRRFDSVSAKHLLWALHFLKSTNPSLDDIARLLHTNRTTLKLHVKKMLLRLLIILPKVWMPRTPLC